MTRQPEAHNPESVANALEYVADVVRKRDDWGKVSIESNYAWLMLDVWVCQDPKIPVTMTTPFKFAVWLYTGVAYACDEHGAADEDSCDLLTWKIPERTT